jgi:hypothetical protein
MLVVGLSAAVASVLESPPASTPSACPVVTHAGPTGACVSYPGIAALPAGPFVIYDQYPMRYFVAAPCHNVSKSQTNCTAFNSGDDSGAPAFAVAGAGDLDCYALGHLSDSQIAPLVPAQNNGLTGVQITYGGGVGGRSVVYKLICNASADPSAGPTHAVETSSPTYHIIWPTPLACKTEPAPASSPGCSKHAVPKPTEDQLLFQEMEMGALVCYNMATADHTQGCGPHHVPAASVFNDAAPAVVDTDQWCKAIASFGGKYATIVAKHVCGFAIWHTSASLPGRNFTYTYGVPAGQTDVVQQFAESCSSVGVKLGIYYSVVSNEYLNVQGGRVRPASTLAPGQIAVTQDEYATIVVQQLTEVLRCFPPPLSHCLPSEALFHIQCAF